MAPSREVYMFGYSSGGAKKWTHFSCSGKPQKIKKCSPARLPEVRSCLTRSCFHPCHSHGIPTGTQAARHGMIRVPFPADCCSATSPKKHTISSVHEDRKTDCTLPPQRRSKTMYRRLWDAALSCTMVFCLLA